MPERDRREARKLLGLLWLGFALPFAILALGALAIAAYQTYEHETFSRGAVEAGGRVAEIVAQATGRTDSHRVRHLPVVEFTTASGQRVSFTSSFRGDPPFRVGDAVDVLYPPARPSTARLAASWSTWGSKVRNWFAAGGLGFLAASAALVALGRSQLRSRP